MQPPRLLAARAPATPLHPTLRPIARAVALAFGLCAAVPPAQAADDDTSQRLPEVIVTSAQPAHGEAERGYRADDVQLGPLGGMRAQDTPFSVSTVPADLLRNTQASNSTEALKYLPTVYASTGASQITPYFTMRGFSASTWTYNMALDGMRSFDIYEPLADKARIEVMTGASGFLYGVTSPAGVVDYVLKRPTRERLAEATLGSYDHQLYGEIDLGGALAQDGDVAYRLNAGYANAGDTGVDHQSQERGLFSGALDWRITPDVKLALDAAWAKRNLDYAQALFMSTAAIGIPDAPDASKNWGAPYTGATDTTARVGAALDARLNDVFTLRTKLRHTEIGREYFLNRQVWQNAQLDYKWRVDSQQKTTTRVDQAQVFLDAEFVTGPLRHVLTAGTTWDDFSVGNNGYRGTTYATVYPGDLYGTPGYRPWSLPPVGASSSQSTTYDTWLVNDRIAFGERWLLMLGATRAGVDDSATARSAAGVDTVTRYDQHKTTPAVALTYKPVEALSVYGAYSEAMQQGFTAAAGTANAGQVFAPFVSKQYELGAKGTLAGLALTGARFRIEQANQYVDAATNLASQDGEAVHEGWEFSLAGKATEYLTLVGGFTLLDAEITKAAANIGKTPQGAVEKTARLYAEYVLPALPALTLTGGVSYTGKVPWDAANTLYVPSYTLYDAGLRYRTRIAGHDTTLRATVANLGGKDYWNTRSGILYLGSPRTLALSATVAF